MGGIDERPADPTQSDRTGDALVARGDRLNGRVALVAGATRGAGRAIAVELARAGAYVYAMGRSNRVSGRSDMARDHREDG